MEVMGNINFKLEGFTAEYDNNSGFTTVYPTLVVNVPEEIAKRIIDLDENMQETLKINIAKKQVKFIRGDYELFRKMIKEFIESNGTTQEEAIEQITNWEFWKDQIDFETIEFKYSLS